MIKRLLLLSICYLVVTAVSAQRQKINLNKSWKFTPGYVVAKNVFTTVNVPIPGIQRMHLEASWIITGDLAITNAVSK
ncbi:MAG: hypothetical protein N4A71_04040 [Carboxylicivirga sp.]|jgi:ATP sulfurylase|nr:hypothetical protein [Carboxylicivirga sp.]